MWAHGKHRSLETPLSSNANTDAGERPVETDVLLLRRVDAAIHCSEEEITAIAETDFRVRITERNTREPSDIGDRNGSRAILIRRPLRIVMPILTAGIAACMTQKVASRLVMHLGTLPTEENSRIGAPVKVYRHVRTVPNNRHGR